MLAIKSAFARKEDKTSIVFDEVDTGVSGRVAQAIAQKIHKIGSHGQGFGYQVTFHKLLPLLIISSLFLRKVIMRRLSLVFVS